MIFDYGQPIRKRSEIMQGAIDASIEDSFVKLEQALTTPANQEPPKPLTAESIIKMAEGFRIEYPKVTMKHGDRVGLVMPRIEFFPVSTLDVSIGLFNDLVMPVQPMPFAPIKTDDGYALLSDLEHATMFYKVTFGHLPCGKSNRSRMVKKRNKKIMKWFKETKWKT